VKLYLIRSDLLSTEELRKFMHEEFPVEPLVLLHQARIGERTLTLHPKLHTQYGHWHGSLLQQPLHQRPRVLPLRHQVRQLKAS
jgi:hypothetical protein